MFKNKEKLAKFAIEYYFYNKQEPDIKENQVSPYLRKIIPCFVTLYIDNKLRGCIGNYSTDQPLFKNIIENAIKSAFFDFRFPQLSKNELQKLKINVSCLTPLKKLNLKDKDKIIKYLNKYKPGLLIKSSFNIALFLPQVWVQLPNAKDFLSELCLKAGLSSNYWEKNKCDLQYFTFKTF